MSTNDLKELESDQFRKTVFTTDKGRIIDLVIVVNLQDNPVLITSYNFQDKVKAHLDKYIIMDDVHLNKADEEYLHLIITGSDLAELGKKLTDTEVRKHKVYHMSKGGFLFYDDFKTESLNIILKEKEIVNYKDILESMDQISCEEYEFHRIEAGIPEGENELNEQINPVECGLSQYISFTKGCYIGQEVIARLDSQGKIPKQMIKIKSGTKFNKDDKIYVDEKETGFISSAVNYNGNYTGLGFIRSMNLNFEKNYFTEHENNKVKLDIYKIN